MDKSGIVKIWERFFLQLQSRNICSFWTGDSLVVHSYRDNIYKFKFVRKNIYFQHYENFLKIYHYCDYMSPLLSNKIIIRAIKNSNNKCKSQ